jgi:hypothetical protein
MARLQLSKNWSTHPVEDIWLKAYLPTLFPCEGTQLGGFVPCGTRSHTQWYRKSQQSRENADLAVVPFLTNSLKPIQS